MQSTLDRRVMALMLRAARRQQAAARRPAPEARALPARLTEDAWWLDAPQPAQTPCLAPASQLAAVNDNKALPVGVSADE